MSVTGRFCFLGRHFYPDKFTECPTHASVLTLFNVRVRTKYYTIKKPDGSKTNDYTFQQKAVNEKEAARVVIDAIFGDRLTAEFHVRGIEVWKAEMQGPMQDLIDPRRKWRGKAE